MDALNQLLGTTLLLVAHPDDEVIAAGALMQRMKKPIVVFATDGAPRSDFFWRQYGSRENYAEVRKKEALEALRIVGAEPIFLWEHVDGGIVDQELFLRLSAAIPAFEKIVAETKPNGLLTIAYEGGHPDHDAACFIASHVGKRGRIPVWESPLYHRDANGEPVVQAFPNPNGSEIQSTVEGEPLQRKLAMVKAYESQKGIVESFHPVVEVFRPVEEYDFSQPPLPWKLNYEYWQWNMTGQSVAAEFASYLELRAPQLKAARSETV